MNRREQRIRDEGIRKLYKQGITIFELSISEGLSQRQIKRIIESDHHGLIERKPHHPNTDPETLFRLRLQLYSSRPRYPKKPAWEDE